MPQDPLDLLCIEPRFPGRLGGVADWLVRRRGYRARFFCRRADPPESWPEATGRGMDVVAFEVGGVAKEPDADWTRVLERSLCYSYACWEVLDARRPRPVDIVLGRSDGLGSSLFAPVAFPGAPVVQLFDGYSDPARLGPVAEAERHARIAANAVELVELENGVVPWTPTEYQRGLFPPEYRDDFLVLFDGVETRGLPPRGRGALSVAGRTIPAGARVVTAAAGSLDRARGFDRFARLVGRVQRDFPDLIAVAVGSPGGIETPVGVDPERLWLPGPLPEAERRRLLARSDLHADLSRPGPSSRTLAEAMAAGSVILASDHGASREFLRHGVDGLLSDGPDADFDLASGCLRRPDASLPLGIAARDVVRERYARDVTLPGLAGLFDRLVASRA